MPDLVSQVMEYESGLLTAPEAIDLFAELISSGMAWQLQGSYGRTAQSLIDAGYISPNGELLRSAD